MHRKLTVAVAAATAAAAVAAAVAASALARERKRKRRAASGRAPYHKRVRADRPGPFDLDVFAAMLDHLGVGFESYFRLPRGLFNEVLGDIRPRLRTAHPEQAAKSCGHAITPEHRLAVALRFFAGAMWQDIVVDLRPMSKAEVFNSVWLVVDAVNDEYAGKWDYPRPGAGAPHHELAAAATFYSYLEAGFRDKSPMGCLHGVIGAVDGCIFRVKSPGRAVDNPADHWCERKKTHGMLLMAVADADMVIRDWSVAHTPKCHDSTAWAGCDLGAWVNAGGLPWPFCILGDSAFRPGCAGLLTPGTAAATTDNFKYVQSRGRMPAEQCFGILVRTWGVLWRELAVRCDRRAPLLSALIHLHNARRAARAPLQIEAGHQVRMHAGKLQWGLWQRRVSPQDASSVGIVWADAPELDEQGRLVELMGDLKHAFQAVGAPRVAPPPPGGRSAADRAAMLEASIASAGVCRPPKTSK